MRDNGVSVGDLIRDVNGRLRCTICQMKLKDFEFIFNALTALKTKIPSSFGIFYLGFLGIASYFAVQANNGWLLGFIIMAMLLPVLVLAIAQVFLTLQKRTIDMYFLMGNIFSDNTAFIKAVEAGRFGNKEQPLSSPDEEIVIAETIDDEGIEGEIKV